MSHECESALVTCIDYRFQDFIRKWCDENLRERGFDYIALAGSTKDLETVKTQIDISLRLHHISNLVLIHHQDCGAYGAEGNFEKHKEDLMKAKEKINEDHPDLNIALYYLKLNGIFEKIE